MLSSMLAVFCCLTYLHNTFHLNLHRGKCLFFFMIKHTHIKRQNRNLEVCRGVPLLYQGMKRDIAGNEEGSNMDGFGSKASITDSCLAFQVLDM